MHLGAIAVCVDLPDAAAVAVALSGVDAPFLHCPMPSGPANNQTWNEAFFGAAYQEKLPLLVYVTGEPSGARFPSFTILDGITEGMNAVLGSGIPSIVLQSAFYLENLHPELFAPLLRSESKLGYPPVPHDLKMQRTSYLDEAKLAVEAFARPELAGQAFEIGSSDTLAGAKLASHLSGWLNRDVIFDPASREAFCQRVGEALNNPCVVFVLSDLYGSIAALERNVMSVGTATLETTFGVTLTSLADHIKSWS